MAISIVCQNCHSRIKAPDVALGKTVKCPKCATPIKVGAVTPEPPPVATVYEPPVAVVYVPPPEAKIADVQPVEDTKACPFCCERVHLNAKKCKHCGKTIDVALRAEEAKRAGEAGQGADRMANRLPQPVVVTLAGDGEGSTTSTSKVTVVASGGSYSPKIQKPRKYLFSCLFLVFLGLICSGYFSCGGWFFRGSMKSHTDTGDALWQRGDKPGAVQEYKAAYAGWFVKSNDKEKMLPRIVEFETTAGNTDEAKKWIQRGLDDKLKSEYTDPAAKELFTAVVVQKDKKDYDGWFVASNEKEKMVLRIVEYELKAGNTEEAKKWISRGLNDRLNVEYSDPASNQLFAAVQKEQAEAREKPAAEARSRAEADAKPKAAAEAQAESERREREAIDRQRRAELRKNKPEQEARQAKEEAAYLGAKEEAASRRVKEQAAYQTAKAEYDAARKLKVSRGFSKSADEASLKGDTKVADRFARAARDRYEQVVKESPGTVAARDAEQLLEGKTVVDRPLPPEPQEPVAVAEERLPAERLTSLARCADLAAIGDWGSELQQIPATVVDKGVLKHVPYQSFRAGDYEFNVYGDPDHPACVEIGVSKGLLKSKAAKANCVAFMASLLPDAGDRCILRSLQLTQDLRKRGRLTFEVTPDTAEDAYDCWWVSVYDEAVLGKSRATPKELATITERKDSTAATPGMIASWTPDDLRLSRPSSPDLGANGGTVYVKGYTRKDGTYVEAHTRAAPGSGGRKK